ncbi:MAG: hypothetical protein JSW50_07985 [Candidatus Latescibacterota bacterium]|nr:MAG: hypothetical protein JSW50_07985 [Candidatus Latescibacterota bacterium]
MYRLVIAAITLASIAGPALGQPGTIALYSGPGALDCAVYDTQAGALVQVEVFHMLTSFAMGSQWAVPMPGCATGLTWIGDTNYFMATVGHSQTGVGIGYAVCQSGPIHLMTINYWGLGQTAMCCPLTVEPDPGRLNPPREILMVDCNIDLFVATGTPAIINPTPSCTCPTVRSEETTWGRVKALYLD